MKRVFKTRVVPVVLCFTLMASTPTLTQRGVASQQDEDASAPTLPIICSPAGVTFQQPDEAPGVRVLSSQVLAKSVVAARLATLKRTDEELQALSKHLVDQGYRARTEQANHFGWDVAFQRPGDQPARVRVLVQDYTKQGSADPAAVGTITVTARGRSDTYSFSVVAPGGKFENAIESRVDKKRLNVLRANSFWSCFVGRVRSKCATTCITALGTCLTTAGGTWVAYLGCLAASCGVCAAKAFGCCGCDCSWWCRWAVGCCDR